MPEIERRDIALKTHHKESHLDYSLSRNCGSASWHSEGVSFISHKYSLSLTSTRLRSAMVLPVNPILDLQITGKAESIYIEISKLVSTAYGRGYRFSFPTADHIKIDRLDAEPITAFSDYGGTVTGTVQASSTAHGLITGDEIEIVGTDHYDGTYTITKIDDNSFYFTATWEHTETGSWGRIVELVNKELLESIPNDAMLNPLVRIFSDRVEISLGNYTIRAFDTTHRRVDWFFYFYSVDPVDLYPSCLFYIEGRELLLSCNIDDLGFWNYAEHGDRGWTEVAPYMSCVDYFLLESIWTLPKNKGFKVTIYKNEVELNGFIFGLLSPGRTYGEYVEITYSGGTVWFGRYAPDGSERSAPYDTGLTDISKAEIRNEGANVYFKLYDSGSGTYEDYTATTAFCGPLMVFLRGNEATSPQIFYNVDIESLEIGDSTITQMERLVKGIRKI